MTTETQQMLAALQQVHDDYHGKIADIDGRVGQAETEYGTFAANLKGVVSAQMHFTAAVDPDEANPTNVAGGTFTTLKAAIEAAPAGSAVDLTLLADKTHPVSANINVDHKFVQFTKSGSGADPIIDFVGLAGATHNNLCGFVTAGLCYFRFRNIHLRLPTARPNGDLPWSSDRAAINTSIGASIFCGMQACRVTGGIVGDNLGVMTANGAAAAHLNMWTTVLDGPIYGVVSASDGLALIARSAVTLANGANYAQSATTNGYLAT